jgi:hypothetical protein
VSELGDATHDVLTERGEVGAISTRLKAEHDVDWARSNDREDM